MAIKIITTEDGSHSLFDDELNETYHSIRGAIGESTLVFLKEGLQYFLNETQSSRANILEIGFGTGLNAFLTAKFATERKIDISFTSLEPFPIEREIFENLNYHQSEKEKELFQKLHDAEWEKKVEISSKLALEKISLKLENFNTTQLFHILYFDAFAPSKQAEVWSLENLKKCFSLLSQNGILITYCAQGQFKRNLAEAGFQVETLQGAMGKKEMVRGIKR
ncbi:MAG: tRNA (5-methylaminomethyl-2-thiouridine)(34)-methyltransferase MnmD [Cyclobacteriaceae bacterium]